MKPSVLLLLGLSIASIDTLPTALGQPALERLEQRIRQRVEAPSDERPDGDGRPAPQTSEPRRGGELGYLGLTADDQRDRGRGARILDVQPGGPAEQAGLRPQDLIAAVSGVRVRQVSDMSEVLSMFRPGQTLDFDVLCDGKRHSVRVVLGQRPTGVQRRAALADASSPETLPLPPGEVMPEPPEAEVEGPGLEPATEAKAAPPDASRIERLERRIEKLERRVSELERSLKAQDTP